MALFKYKKKSNYKMLYFVIIGVSISLLILLWKVSDSRNEFFSGSNFNVPNKNLTNNISNLNKSNSNSVYTNYSSPFTIDETKIPTTPFYNSQSLIRNAKPDSPFFITPDPTVISKVFKDGIPANILSVSDFERVTKLKGFNITDYTDSLTPEEVETHKIITDDLTVGYAEADPLTQGVDQRFNEGQGEINIFSQNTNANSGFNGLLVNENKVQNSGNINSVNVNSGNGNKNSVASTLNLTIEIAEIIEQIKTAKASIDSNPELSDSIMTSVKQRLNEIPELSFTNSDFEDLDLLSDNLRTLTLELTTGINLNQNSIGSGSGSGNSSLENIISGIPNGNQIKNTNVNGIQNQIGNQIGNVNVNRLQNQISNQLGNINVNGIQNQVNNQIGNVNVNQLQNQIGNVNVSNQVSNQVQNQNINQIVNVENETNKITNEAINKLKLLNVNVNSNTNLTSAGNLMNGLQEIGFTQNVVNANSNSEYIPLPKQLIPISSLF